METTYYTLTSREVIISGDGVAQAAGGAPERQVVLLRTAANTASAPARADNVIDLAAWRSAREEEARLEEEWYGGVDEAPAQPAPAQPSERRAAGRRAAGDAVGGRHHGGAHGPDASGVTTVRHEAPARKIPRRSFCILYTSKTFAHLFSPPSDEGSEAAGAGVNDMPGACQSRAVTEP